MVAHLRRDGLEFTVGVFEEFLGALDADVGEMLHRSAAEFAAADAAEVFGADGAAGGERREFPVGREFASDRFPECADA